MLRPFVSNVVKGQVRNCWFELLTRGRSPSLTARTRLPSCWAWGLEFHMTQVDVHWLMEVDAQLESGDALMREDARPTTMTRTEYQTIHIQRFLSHPGVYQHFWSPKDSGKLFEHGMDGRVVSCSQHVRPFQDIDPPLRKVPYRLSTLDATRPRYALVGL